jgi:hypothetical protein
LRGIVHFSDATGSVLSYGIDDFRYVGREGWPLLFQVLLSETGTEMEISTQVGICRRYHPTKETRWKSLAPGGHRVISDFDHTSWASDHFLLVNGHWGFYQLCPVCQPTNSPIPPSSM